MSLGQSRAKDFDPFGGDGEHPAEAKAVVDQDTNSTWSTERYDGGVINNKPGVGIYVDAKPGVAAKRDRRISPTRNWQGDVYAAPTARRRPCSTASRSSHRSRRARPAPRVKLDPADKRYRYYLVWITKLPPGGSSVSIAEIRLFRLGTA